jgi:hypothetical protein
MTTGLAVLVPRTLAEAMEFSKLLADSDLVPKDYKGRPANVLVALQWGAEIGLRPLQALQNISVINGRPAIWGDAALALVRASPLCEDVIERITGEGDKMIATCEAKRRGSASVISTFSMADAKRAGLAGKQGPWQQYTARMLQQRARGFALRDAFPDVLRGVITVEEARDIPTTIDITPKREAIETAFPEHDPHTGEVQSSDVLASLISQGDDAAQGGVVGFTAWWNSREIKPRRNDLRQHLEGWKIQATAADERGAAAPDAEEEPADELPLGTTEPPENWTTWAREIVESMRAADEPTLAGLRTQARTLAADVPPHIMADVDRAYDARRAELR